MREIKNALIVLFSLAVGFGVWYGIFWLFTNEQNAFAWSTVVKIFYIMFSILTTESTTKFVSSKNIDIV